MKKIHFKNINKITYWRRPTKDDIKFGHGAIHYRNFETNLCFDENDNLKLKVRASDDNLVYYYECLDCLKFLKLQKIEIPKDENSSYLY